jgi:soluble lytic murein transglycosylase
MMWNCLALNIPARWFSLPIMLSAALSAQTPLDTLARNYHDHPSPATRAAVLAYSNAHSKDLNGAMALLVLGSGEMDGKQFPDAQKHLSAAEKRLPKLADYPAYLKAAADFELKNYAQVEKDLKPVWDNTPTSPLVVKAVLLEANAYLASGDPKKAIHLLEERGSEAAPEKVTLLLAKAYEASGDTAAASAQYVKLYTEYPLTKEAEEAHAPLTPQARLTRCAKLIDGKDYARARRELEPLVAELTGPDRDTARLLIGVTYYQERDRLQAFNYLKSLDLAPGETAAQRLFYLAESARRLDHIDEMDAAIAQLGQSYAASKWRLQALVGAGNYYVTKNQPDLYEPLFRACYESFPSDPLSSNCRWRVAWGEYLKDRTKPELFAAHLKQYPSSEHASAALYFLGRIAESKGDYAAARTYYEKSRRDYPNEYYGVLSRDRLSESAVAHAQASPQADAFLAGIAFQKNGSPEMRPSPLTLSRIERGRLLESGGLDDLADSELRYGARHDGQPQLLAVEMARQATARNEPDQAIRLIKHYAPGYMTLPLDASTDALWRYAFPLPFWKSLALFAGQRGLDPYLLAGLIRQESEFNPKVVSYANAYGLTQVLPSTGREISRRLKIRPFRASMLFTPDVNLNIGTYYLRNVLDSLQGKYEAALASYNAGKSRVVKWMGWNDFREPAEFVESIPFTQTRDYVQSVMRNADVYRRLYGGNQVALASTEYGIGTKDASTAVGGLPAKGAVSKREDR